MAYIKEKDLIYSDLAAYYDDYYLEDLIFLVEDNYKNLPTAEVIHQRLTRTLYHSTAALPTATDVLLLLLFHRDYITAEQMVRLGLFGSSQSALNTVSRLKKRTGKKGGALQGLSSTSGTSVYALSRQERAEHILSDIPTGDYTHRFPERYVKDNGIRESGECPESVRDHDLELLYLFYDLVKDENLIDFQWLPSCVLGPGLSFEDVLLQVKRFAHSLPRTEYPPNAIVPDAVILPWDGSFRHIYFIEQDMLTESIGKLIEKFTKYNNLVGTHSRKDLACESIILPTFIKRGVGDDAEAERMRSSNQIKNMLPEIKSVMSSYGVTSFKELEKRMNEEVRKRKGLDEDDNSRARTGTGSLFTAMRIMKFLSRVSQFDKTIDNIDDLKRYIAACEERDMRRISDKAEERAVVAMRRRMAQFKSAVLESGIKSRCLNGLSVFAYDNRSNAVPYIFLHDSGLMKDLAELCRMSLYEPGTSRTASIAPSEEIEYGKETYVLRNVIRFKDTKLPTAVEVVGLDIGGMLRIERILSLMDTAFPCNLCLVVSSVSEAAAINQEFMVRDVFFTETEARKQKGVTTVAYCLMEPSLSGKRLFFFDSDGKVCYR